MKEDYLAKYVKFFVGLVFWVPTSYAFAYWTHIAPEGIYDGMGSSMEVISVLFMFAFFGGIPVLTGLWIFRK